MALSNQKTQHISSRLFQDDIFTDSSLIPFINYFDNGHVFRRY